MNLTWTILFLPLIFLPLASTLLAKFSRASGSLCLSFYRQAGIIIVGLPIILFNFKSLSILSEYWFPFIMATSLGALYVYLVFLGFDYLPIGLSKIFSNISRALFSILVGLFILTETLSNLQIIGIIFLLAGILLLKPKHININHLKKKNPYLGIGIGILAGIVGTLNLYYLKIISEHLNAITTLYVFEVGMGVFLGFVLIFNRKKFKIYSKKDYGIILLLSPLSIIGTYGLVKAYQLLDYTVVNVSLVFTLVSTIIFGWVIFNEKLKKKQLLIISLMIIGLIFVNL